MDIKTVLNNAFQQAEIARQAETIRLGISNLINLNCTLCQLLEEYHADCRKSTPANDPE
jgi:hypothetical protein